MTIDNIDEFLEHHGVKGQKWGVRKDKGVHGYPPSKSKQRTVHPISDDAATARALRKKPLHSLTNQELKIVTERQRLEQNFKQLNPTKVNSGKKKAKEILATIGIVTTAYNMAHSPLVQSGKDFLKQRKLLKVTELLSNSGPG